MSKCPTCGKKFSRPQGLGAHLRYNHKRSTQAAPRNGSPSPAPARARAGSTSKSIEVIDVDPRSGVAVEIRTLGYPARTVKTFNVFGRSTLDIVTRVRKSLI